MDDLELEPSIIATLCAGCHRVIDSDLPDADHSVNLTPDVLYIGEFDFLFDEPISTLNVAYDWHDVRCFALWAFTHAIAAGAFRRPDAVGE